MLSTDKSFQWYNSLQYWQC